MIAGGEVAASADRARAGASLARDTVAVRLASVMAASVTAATVEFVHDPAASEDQNPIAEAFKLDAVRGRNQHREALVGDVRSR